MMKIILLIAVSALFSAGASAAKPGSKAGSKPPQCFKHHDFDNLNVNLAMTGYDSFIGNPFDAIVDPGVKATIFDPDCSILLEDVAANGQLDIGSFTATSVHETFGFYGFISRAGQDLNCNSDFSMKTFQDMRSYNSERTQSNEAALSGSVSGNVNAWGVAMKASASYSKETNSNEKAASKLLERRNGEIILAEATCITESVSIAKEVRPMFTGAFIKQLEKLDSVSSSDNSKLKEDTVREFIHEFGTHFSQETKLGATLTYERRFSTKSSENEKGNTRSECVKQEAKASVEAQHAVGGGAAKISGKSKECEDLKDESKFNDEDGIESTRIISRGSRPKTLQEWVDAAFAPVPIKRYLAPLSDLFKDEWLSKNEHYGFQKSLKGKALRTLFDDAFGKYCALMLGDILDENCEHISCTGYECGSNGQCKMDETTDRPYCECDEEYMGDHCENKKDPYAYIKLEGKAEQCAPGMEIASEAECNDANTQILVREILSGIITKENRRAPHREKLSVGSWNRNCAGPSMYCKLGKDVPGGCSYKARGDKALIFNHNPVSDAVNFLDGTYKMVCRQASNQRFGGCMWRSPSRGINWVKTTNGYAIEGVDWPIKGVGSAEECAKQCQLTTKCNGFQFYGNLDLHSARDCYLLQNVTRVAWDNGSTETEMAKWTQMGTNGQWPDNRDRYSGICFPTDNVAGYGSAALANPWTPTLVKADFKCRAQSADIKNANGELLMTLDECAKQCYDTPGCYFFQTEVKGGSTYGFGGCRWVQANSERCDGYAVDGSKVYHGNGEAFQSDSNWDFYKVSNRDNTIICDAVEADAASSCITLVQPFASCESDDDWLGWVKEPFSLEECTKACIREPNCRYFVHGVGGSDNREGYCYLEKPNNPKSGDFCSDGWNNDYYDFYKLNVDNNEHESVYQPNAEINDGKNSVSMSG